MTEEEQIKKHARAEVFEAHARLSNLVAKLSHPSGTHELKYDEVNDIAEFLNHAAWRLKP